MTLSPLDPAPLGAPDEVEVTEAGPLVAPFPLGEDATCCLAVDLFGCFAARVDPAIAFIEKIIEMKDTKTHMVLRMQTTPL